MNVGEKATRKSPESSNEVSLHPLSNEVREIFILMNLAAEDGVESYERFLQMPQIDKLTGKLEKEETSRVDRMIYTYIDAIGSDRLENAPEPQMMERLYPKAQVGDCSQTLHLLHTGETHYRDSDYRGDVRDSYFEQCEDLAGELGKKPSDLTLFDLGHGILTGSFNPRPELRELS